MNTEAVKKILKPIVKEAINEEIKEILTEAIKIASSPSEEVNESLKQESKPEELTPEQKQAMNEERARLRREYNAMNPIEKIMHDTKQNMTNENNKPNPTRNKAASLGMLDENAGTNLTDLPFVKKAKKVYDKSVEIKR